VYHLGLQPCLAYNLSMATTKETLAKVESQVVNIEKRLDKGDAKFDAMDAKYTKYIVGLYVLIIGMSGVDRIFS